MTPNDGMGIDMEKREPAWVAEAIRKACREISGYICNWPRCGISQTPIYRREECIGVAKYARAGMRAALERVEKSVWKAIDPSFEGHYREAAGKAVAAIRALKKEIDDE